MYMNLLKRFISRISPEYDKSLLYMLQASEYNLHDYFAWYRRVTDFRHVQRRKKLVWTTKIKALYASEVLLVIIVSFIGIRASYDLNFPYVVIFILLLGTAMA